MSILIVEHHMDVVMSVCDRLYVLNFGEVIASGDAEKVRRDPAVIAAYLGTGVA
jgi:branched-chain amino acid transport system ATP-binding protein